MKKLTILSILLFTLGCTTNEMSDESTEKEQSWFEKFDNQLWVEEGNEPDCSIDCSFGMLFKSNKTIIFYDYWDNDFESLCGEIIYTNFVKDYVV